MSEFNILMPKMGESVQEATITKWFVKVGDTIEEDDVLFEIATEKVDSEIPSPVDGVISKINFDVDAVVPVGEVVAVVSLDGQMHQADENTDNSSDVDDLAQSNSVDEEDGTNKSGIESYEGERFYSPLVKSMAKKEGIKLHELDQIKGSGAGGRVNKDDLLKFIEGKDQIVENRKTDNDDMVEVKDLPKPAKHPVAVGENDQIIEMDRVRKLIADHMVNSVHTAPHVTSVVEADVTNLVLWRSKVKDQYLNKYKEKLTYMPIFTEAVAMALREFPMVNASFDGDKIIVRSKVNIGITVAKPDGNLIVPVIKDADQKNLVGLTSSLNDLANRSRNNKLSPDEISGGTFSITNFGSFRNIIGTPIINQPQVAILATGSIEKKPAVLETPTGDVIAIRHKMFLSLSYDHRIVDGALGGAFLRKIADILEGFDINRDI